MPAERRALSILLVVTLATCALVARALVRNSPTDVVEPQQSTATLALSAQPPVATNTPVAVALFSSTPMPPVKRTPSPSPTTLVASPATRTLAPGPTAQVESPLLLAASASSTAPFPEPAPRDPLLEARELGRINATQPEPRDKPSQPQIGAQKRFWISDLDGGATREITASLRYASSHLHMWVEEGVAVDEKGLARSAQAFEERIYGTIVAPLGAQRSQGSGSTDHISVLNAEFTGAAGYFSRADQYSKAANPFSNDRQMIYVNLHDRTPGTDPYARTLAHELQHLIHWHADHNEDAWVTEGASELAEVLCGYGPQEVNAFFLNPDIQLTTWGSTAGGLAHYDASYLWSAYFAERFGVDRFHEVIQHPANGSRAFDAVLASVGPGLTFDEVFSDWVLANYLDDPELADGRYGYNGIDFGDMATELLAELPVSESRAVSQYGTTYVELAFGEASLAQVAFTGTVTVPLVPTTPHSGRFHWWSNRADGSDMTLTRAFDLAAVTDPTLEFWLWYDIEESWDHAYVQASVDGGRTWEILAGRYSSAENPYGESYGPAYTGRSEGWVEDAIDLSAYAGKTVLIRFQMLTDDAVNLPGLCLDDIRIPELGYVHDTESSEDQWEADGFVRTDNTLPQRFAIQLVTLGGDTEIERLELDRFNYGSWTIERPESPTQRMVLAISGLTPLTTEPARYELSVR